MKCPLTDSLMKAINRISVALMQDLLWRKWRGVFPRPILRAVLWWINNPMPDDDLGRNVVLELKANGVDVWDFMY